MSQGAFVCFLRPQGVFVFFVERLFSGVRPIIGHLYNLCNL